MRKEVSVAAGKIICMSSVHEVIPWSGHVNYASSKGGINMMMKSMAQELAPHRIRVNSIGPGAIRTPINTSAWNSPEAYADLMTLIPYKRIGEPEDIANVAVFLASDMADYINGVTHLRRRRHDLLPRIRYRRLRNGAALPCPSKPAPACRSPCAGARHRAEILTQTLSPNNQTRCVQSGYVPAVSKQGA